MYTQQRLHKSMWGTMIGCVASLAGTVLAQDCQPEVVGSIGGDSALGLAVSGGVAYVANGLSGLQVIDVSDAANPILTGAVDTPALARGVAVSGGVAYVADDDSGLQVIDVSDPSSPAIIGAVALPGSAWSVAVSGDVAYVADGLAGLFMVDVSDPSSPAVVGAIDTPGFAFSVAVSSLRGSTPFKSLRMTSNSEDTSRSKVLASSIRIVHAVTNSPSIAATSAASFMAK